MKYLLIILLFFGCLPGSELQVKNIFAKVTDISLFERIGIENRIAVSFIGMNNIRYFLVADMCDSSKYQIGTYYSILVTR